MLQVWPLWQLRQVRQTPWEEVLLQMAEVLGDVSDASALLYFPALCIRAAPVDAQSSPTWVFELAAVALWQLLDPLASPHLAAEWSALVMSPPFVE